MNVRRRVQTGTDQHARIEQAAGTRPVDLAAGRTVDRNRHVVRGKELIEAVQRLDTTTDSATAQAIMQWINDEYESRQGGRLVGLFGRCYLGAPYVDHRMDLTGGHILEHYTQEDTPPPAFQPARPFARSDAYVFVEVYDDGTVVPIRPDGRPVI